MQVLMLGGWWSGAGRRVRAGCPHAPVFVEVIFLGHVVGFVHPGPHGQSCLNLRPRRLSFYHVFQCRGKLGTVVAVLLSCSVVRTRSGGWRIRLQQIVCTIAPCSRYRCGTRLDVDTQNAHEACSWGQLARRAGQRCRTTCGRLARAVHTCFRSALTHVLDSNVWC